MGLRRRLLDSHWCNVTHTYTTIGTYYASLTVTDSAGNKASTTVTVTVQAKPTPTPTPPQPLHHNLAYTNPTPHNSTPPQPLAPPNTIPATVPDGSTEQFTITETSPPHKYPTPQSTLTKPLKQQPYPSP